MLGLYMYLDTLIIGHTFAISISILNELTLQRELQNNITNYVFWTTTKNNTTTKRKIKHKNPCQGRELNPGPVTSQSDALPLLPVYHRVN